MEDKTYSSRCAPRFPLCAIRFCTFKLSNGDVVSSARMSIGQCRPDEILMIWFDKDGYIVHAKIDLTAKTFQCIGTVDDPNAASVPATPQFSGPFPPHMTDKQVERVRELTDDLPAKESQAFFWNDSGFKAEYHIAFYKGEVLQVYGYSKSNLPKEFVEFLKFLGLEKYYIDEQKSLPVRSKGF
jgi:hypothetical protein